MLALLTNMLLDTALGVCLCQENNRKSLQKSVTTVLVVNEAGTSTTRPAERTFTPKSHQAIIKVLWPGLWQRSNFELMLRLSEVKAETVHTVSLLPSAGDTAWTTEGGF